MKHIHHIVPRYMGGDDSPENLIECTIEQHSEFHRELYEKYGNKEDLIAWKGLAGKIGKEEIMLQLCSLGGTRGSDTGRENQVGAFFDPEIRQRSQLLAAKTKGKNKGASWWFNGTEYKFCIEQPHGYTKSSAPNNPGKKTKNTKWWNNGVSNKRSIGCPGEEWVTGRIFKSI